MNKKGSLSLSINAIVVLILAIVMLGLALGFIKTMFGKVSGQVEALVANEPEPNPAGPSDPLTLSRSTIVIGSSQTSAIKFNVYSPFAFALGEIIDTPGTGCFAGTPPPLTIVTQLQKGISAGGTASSQMIVRAKSSADNIVCQICSVDLDPGTEVYQSCADVNVIIK